MADVPDFYYNPRNRPPSKRLGTRYHIYKDDDFPIPSSEHTPRRCSNIHCGAILDTGRYFDDEMIECDFCGNREPRDVSY